MLCGLFYRPPSSDRSILAQLESSLDELPPSLSKSLLLVGDFNVDLLCSTDLILSSITHKLNLKQVVSSPTKTTATSATLIDHIYLSDDLSHSSCAILPPLHDSDHSSIHLSLRKPSPMSKRAPRRKIWLYKQADFESANEALQCLSSKSFPASNIDSLWSQWYDFYMTVISQSIPSKSIKQSKNLPYLNNELMRAVRKKSPTVPQSQKDRLPPSLAEVQPCQEQGH